MTVADIYTWILLQRKTARSAGKADILPQPLVHQSSLHVVQLLLDHSLVQLHVQAAQVPASRAERMTMTESALVNRPMRRMRKRAPVSTDHFTPGRGAFIVSRSRRRIELLAIAVNPMRAGADRISHSSDTVQRARAGMAATTPRTSKLRTNIVDPALAHIDLDRPFDFALRSDVDALVAFLPVDRASLTKLILEDQSIQNPLRLVHRATHISIIDRHGADIAFGINNEQRPLSNALVLDQHAVVATQLVVAVADQRYMNASQPAFHLGGRIPGPQYVLAVCAGEGYGAGAAVEEFLQARGKGRDFCGTDEGPGFGEEDQDEPVLGLGVGREGDFWCWNCMLALRENLVWSLI